MKIPVLFYLIGSAFALPLDLVGDVINSPENILRLTDLGPNDLAEELSGQFEGDIVWRDELVDILDSEDEVPQKYRWSNNRVPFKINKHAFDAEQSAQIMRGIKAIEKVTCIRFIPYVSLLHKDYIEVVGNGSGCTSHIGRIGGRQTINLEPYPIGDGCFRLGTIIHEFNHALGFRHMQSAADRDDFVKIVWKNIQSNKENNFRKFKSEPIANSGVPYDYGSVMHYSDRAFSKNGDRTIVPLKPTKEKMGQRVGLSMKDINRINAIYTCFE